MTGPRPLDQWRQRNAAFWAAAADGWVHDGKYEDLPGVTIRSKSILLVGQFLYKSGYKEALGRQKEWQRTVQEALEKVDFIALPTWIVIS